MTPPHLRQPPVLPARWVRIDHPGARNPHRDVTGKRDHGHAGGEPDGQGVLALSGASLAYAVLGPPAAPVGPA